MEDNSHADLKSSESQGNAESCNHARVADNGTSLVKESESELDGPCLVASLEHENNRNTQVDEYLTDAKQELAQFQNGMTGSIAI